MMYHTSGVHKRRVFVFVVAIALIVVGVCLLVTKHVSAPKGESAVPTQEESRDIPGWLRASDAATGLTFQYPPELGTVYIHTQTWPPTLSLSETPFHCIESDPSAKAELPAGIVTAKTIQGHLYCVTRESEGAAGSTYTTYTYVFPFGAKTAALAFTLRAVQCGNYDEPKKSECETERASFDVGAIVDRMAQSLK